MNIEQAIKAVEKGYVAVGDALYIPDGNTALKHIILTALCEKQERENPKPLTLEQLKERVGKPVYRRWRNGNGTWEVLERIEEKTETGNPVILVFFQHDDWFPERFDRVEFFDHEPKEAHK